MIAAFSLLFSGWPRAVASAIAARPAVPPVVSEIDRIIREGFYDARLKGVDWSAAVTRASAELAKAATPAERDAVYDRLLAHTLRLPHLPRPGGPSSRARLGHDGAPDRKRRRRLRRQGNPPGQLRGTRGTEARRPHPRDRRSPLRGRARRLPRPLPRLGRGAGHVLAGRLTADGRAGEDRPPRAHGRGAGRRARLEERSRHPPRRQGATATRDLWGMSAETALAVVDLLLDREQTERARVGPRGLGRDRRPAARRARQQRRIRSEHPDDVPPGQLELRRLLHDHARGKAPRAAGLRAASRRSPRQLGNGIVGRGARAEVPRRTGSDPIVGETTAGMMSGGAAAERLSDGSTLWYTARAIESLDGKSYEGSGVAPDVPVADRPPCGRGTGGRDRRGGAQVARSALGYPHRDGKVAIHDRPLRPPSRARSPWCRTVRSRSARPS